MLRGWLDKVAFNVTMFDDMPTGSYADGIGDGVRSVLSKLHDHLDSLPVQPEPAALIQPEALGYSIPPATHDQHYVVLCELRAAKAEGRNGSGRSPRGRRVTCATCRPARRAMTFVSPASWKARPARRGIGEREQAELENAAANAPRLLAELEVSAGEANRLQAALDALTEDPALEAAGEALCVLDPRHLVAVANGDTGEDHPAIIAAAVLHAARTAALNETKETTT